MHKRFEINIAKEAYYNNGVSMCYQTWKISPNVLILA